MGQWRDVSVGEGSMRCYLAGPRDAGGAGVVVCMHGPGLDAFILDVCERLASSGFAAIAPDFYHRQREPLVDAWTKIRDSEASQDMAAAVEALQTLAGVAPGRAGSIGFCMGGRLAFLHAATDPDLRAAVVFHGGNIMVGRDGGPSPFDRTGDIRAAILGLFGAEDENPSPADVQKIGAELTRLNKTHEFHVYEGAGHAFLNFTRPERFREAQARDAWAKCVDWLRRYLSSGR